MAIPTIPSHLQLHIVSADRSLVNEQVDEVEIPGAEGYFGVLGGHTPLLALLGTGELWYRMGSETHYLSLSGGFAEVQPDRVTILAQNAERADEIARGRPEIRPVRRRRHGARPHAARRPRGDLGHGQCRAAPHARAVRGRCGGRGQGQTRGRDEREGHRRGGQTHRTHGGTITEGPLPPECRPIPGRS